MKKQKSHFFQALWLCISLDAFLLSYGQMNQKKDEQGWGQWLCPLEASLSSPFLSITSAFATSDANRHHFWWQRSHLQRRHKNCRWFRAKLFFTQDTSCLGDALFFTLYTFCMIRGFFQFKTLRQMTFMNCRLAFLSLIKINHVRGFRFIARKSRLSFDFSSHVSGTMNYLELW